VQPLADAVHDAVWMYCLRGGAGVAPLGRARSVDGVPRVGSAAVGAWGGACGAATAGKEQESCRAEGGKLDHAAEDTPRRHPGPGIDLACTRPMAEEQARQMTVGMVSVSHADRGDPNGN
jgi:hypothetical protein